MAQVTSGTCDLCDSPVDGALDCAETVSCTGHGRSCEAFIYHTRCLDKWRKANPSKDGHARFACPNGKGKGPGIGMAGAMPCSGVIKNTHEVVVKAPKKATKKAAPPPMPPPRAPAPKPAAPPRPKPAAGGDPQYTAALRTSAQPPAARPPGWGAAERLGSGAGSGSFGPAVEDEGPVDASGEPSLPVGFTLEMALTKAQRRNLKRRQKAQTQQAAAAGCEARGGGAGSDGGASSSGGGAGGGERSTLGAAMGVSAETATPAGPVDHQKLMGTSSFVTDVARFNALLGLTADDSSDDEWEDSGDGEGAAEVEQSQSGGVHLAEEAGGSGQQDLPSPIEAAMPPLPLVAPLRMVAASATDTSVSLADVPVVAPPQAPQAPLAVAPAAAVPLTAALAAVHALPLVPVPAAAPTLPLPAAAPVVAVPPYFTAATPAPPAAVAVVTPAAVPVVAPPSILPPPALAAAQSVVKSVAPPPPADEGEDLDELMALMGLDG